MQLSSEQLKNNAHVSTYLSHEYQLFSVYLVSYSISSLLHKIKTKKREQTSRGKSRMLDSKDTMLGT